MCVTLLVCDPTDERTCAERCGLAFRVDGMATRIPCSQRGAGTCAAEKCTPYAPTCFYHDVRVKIMETGTGGVTTYGLRS